MLLCCTHVDPTAANPKTAKLDTIMAAGHIHQANPGAFQLILYTYTFVGKDWCIDLNYQA